MTPDATRIASAARHDDEKRLDVRWADGHESIYPYAYLRRECPCASCRTEREEARTNPFRVIRESPSDELRTIEPVGRYGLKLVWKDGHATGIYTLEYLRTLCPCDECRAKRPEEGPYVHGIFIPGG